MMCDKVVVDMINQKITKEQVSFDTVYNGQAIDDKFWKLGQVLDNPNIYIRQD